MDYEKIELDIDTIDKMTRESRPAYEEANTFKYHENEEINTQEIVSNGYEFIMECEEEGTRRWNFTGLKCFDIQTLFHEIEAFVSYCLDNTNWNAKISLTYYGFGIDKPVGVTISIEPKDEKTVKLLGLNTFAMEITQTIVITIINNIIEYAKHVVNDGPSNR